MLTNEKGELVEHVFQKIYEHPGWWDALTDEQLAEIRKALMEMEYPEEKPFWMLVRLGDKKLFPVLLDQVDGPWTHMSAEALRVNDASRKNSSAASKRSSKSGLRSTRMIGLRRDTSGADSLFPRPSRN
jgi:hypothetical protein